MKKKKLLLLFSCLTALFWAGGYPAIQASAADAGNHRIDNAVKTGEEDPLTARDIFDSQSGGVFSSLPSTSVSENTSSTDNPEKTSDPDTVENEYSAFAIADVSSYVNVRDLPSTDGQVVGKMYDGSVAQILSAEGSGDDAWFRIVSGSVEGYIKAEYFIYGDDAAAVIEDYVTRYAEVQVSVLNVRKEPDIESSRIGYLSDGEKVKILELGDEWLKVQYAADSVGYIAREYTTVLEDFTHAKSLEEEKAELEAAKAREAARAKETESSKPENTSAPVLSGTNYTSNEELRSSIVQYAMQFLGNKYVSGGRSLSSGTDCSGFTCYLYAEYGYSLSRTPEGQWSSNGRRISAEEIQPGDIVCYSSNGSKCTHVALYIGDGRIIHSANPRKGVVTADIYYDDTFLGIINVID